jgi:hypothetical protein
MAGSKTSIISTQNMELETGCTFSVTSAMISNSQKIHFYYGITKPPKVIK